MTKIVDTAISVVSRDADNLQLLLGVDTRFTGVDLHQGRTGAARFEMTCRIWDDDTFSDDLVTSATHVMEPGSILELTGVDMPFTLPFSDLRKKEPGYESNIELFGDFTLRKNGARVGSSVKSRTLNVKFPEPTPVPNNRRIEVASEGSGTSTVVVTRGSNFKPGSLVVVRITDARLVQLQAAATAAADGTFTARRQVPCLSGVQFTVTAFEDADPSNTFANAVIATCP